MLLLYKFNWFLQGMQWSPDVGSHCIPFTIFYNEKKNVLYTGIVRRVCECSLLQLVKVYGFCEDEERS